MTGSEKKREGAKVLFNFLELESYMRLETVQL